MAVSVYSHSHNRFLPQAPIDLETFNKDLGAGSDLARLNSLKSDVRVTEPLVDYINLLQIEAFIPARTALLIKNNLNDHPFVKNTISSLLYDLQQHRLFSDNCFQYLHGKLNQGSLEDLFQCLHAIMLYERIAKEQIRSCADPAFRFESSSSYSEKLIRLHPDTIQVEWQKLQEQYRHNFLTHWLINFSTQSDCASQVKTKILSLVDKLHTNDPAAFKQLFLEFLNEVQNSPHTIAIEKICWEEFAKAVKSTRPEQFANKVYQVAVTEEYYRSCIQKVHLLGESMRMSSSDELKAAADKCKKAYNGSVFVLQDHKNLPPCCPTRFAAFIGRMKNEWMQINNLYTRVLGDTPHSFCSCQAEIPPIQNKLVEWPFNSKPLIQFTPSQLNAVNALKADRPVDEAIYQANHENTVAIIGCDWGGGHREVARGIATHIAKLGYHPVTVNLPEVMIDVDPIRNFFLTKWLGKEWSVGSLFNGLLKAKAFALINFLRSFFKGAPDPETQQRKLLLTLHELLKINPKQVITTYSNDNEAIIESCKLLGIPCLHISTDIDTSVETRKTPPDTDHFKMGIAFKDDEMIKRIKDVTRPDQQVVIGPPVRHEFTLPRSHQDVLRLKQQKGIDINKKVVVISSGKNGAYSVYPEILAKRYAKMSPNDIPIHLIVLCGEGNKEFLAHLERHVVPKTNLPISLFEKAEGDEMEELLAMAADGGVLIGKLGGGTLFESACRGTRILVDNVRAGALSQGITHFFISWIEWVLRKLGYPGQLPWEKINYEFAYKHHLAERFKNIDEFLPKLDALLAHDAPVQLDLEIKNIENEIRDVTRDMILKADHDLAIVRLRQRLLKV